MLRTLRLSKRFISLNSTQRMNHTESVKKAETAQIAKGLTAKRVDFNQPDPQKFEKRFDVYRFDPETQTSHYKSYYIDLSTCGPMILDALIKIKDEMDPSLSFRRSCREGICGSCSMSVDGRNTLACLSYIDKDKSYPCVVAPLPFFTVIRDLVVDMTNFYTQYKSINPYLQRKTPKAPGQKEYYQSIEDRNKLDLLYECILCACCQSHCPSYWWQPGEYHGPAVLMQAYRWIIDSRDEYTEERLEKLSGQKLEKCYNIGACSLTCPKGLDPRNAIDKLKNIYYDYKMKKRENLNLL